MASIIEQFKKIGIIPVVVLDDAKDALPLAKVLCEGGLPCAEITFRTEAAEEAIRKISGAYPDMLVGAGTVLNTEQADRALAAGAQFIVSPGLDPELVKHCRRKGVMAIPGVQTPTEIQAAIAMGLNILKFFPAEAAGGLKMIRALAAAFVDAAFMPTGGISEANVRNYLEYERIIACGGSWMVKKDMIAAGEFDRILELVRNAAAIVRETRG